jgi:hypothetical protein
MSEVDLIERYQRLLDELLVRRHRMGALSEDEEVERAEEMFAIWEQLDQDARTTLESWIAEQMRPIPVDAPETLGLFDVADPSVRPFAA